MVIRTLRDITALHLANSARPYQDHYRCLAQSESARNGPNQASSQVESDSD